MHTVNELSAILDKLASDDKFRAHLLNDPVAALAGLGITLSAQDVPEELSLPSKAEIVSERTELLNQVESTGTMIPFLLSGMLAAA
ncbi:MULTISPECIES: NHLP-related RiPP peptide [unclassified Duganella]|jgi:putative modified peptide|uniref:NHLP-related RiPP peptide n=1 Tax=unclassified Duganella TaxID=2636909 RepID=UPI00088A2370|nr:MULTISPECIES: NHLP-related RiPP peptide [unclassified Duganella]SDF65759.1 putative modified peptide [Duganella sp. OV458]SDI63067.1 putative modified peptide [Duganella sp. OV510]